MTLEAGLLTASLVTIATIFIYAVVRRTTTKLPAPMLAVIRITLGVVFAILAVIGGLLPIMQGWIFFLLAVLMLFPRSRFAVKACDKIEPKMPRLVAWLRRMHIGLPREDAEPAVQPVSNRENE